MGNVQIVKITDRHTTPSVLTLLQSCRRVRGEAAAIFYQINDLSIDTYAAETGPPGPPGLDLFVRDVKGERLDLITKLTVNCKAERDTLKQILWDAIRVSNLRTLDIRLLKRCPMFRYGVELVTQMSSIERIGLTTSDVKYAGKLKEIEKELQNMIDQQRAVSVTGGLLDEK